MALDSPFWINSMDYLLASILTEHNKMLIFWSTAANSVHKDDKASCAFGIFLHLVSFGVAVKL